MPEASEGLNAGEACNVTADNADEKPADDVADGSRSCAPPSSLPSVRPSSTSTVLLAT